MTVSIKSRSSRAHVWSSLERQTFHSAEKSSGNEAMSGGGSMQVHRQFVGLGTGGSLYIARPHHSHLRLHPLYVRKGAKGVASRFSAPKYSAACYLQLTELLMSCRFSARTTLTSVLEFRYCPVPESNSQDSSGLDPFQLHFRNTLVREEQSSRVLSRLSCVTEQQRRRGV